MKKKNYYLFLDDVRYPKDVTWVDVPEKPWTIVRNYKDFCRVIENQGVPQFVCYDHDLADMHYNTYHNLGEGGELKIDYSKFEEKTGYSCARFLCEFCEKQNIKHPPYVVHSMSVVGKQNIISVIESYNKSLS